MFWRANLDEATTNWRAVCGRTARTVRRAGRAHAFPTPIGTSYRFVWKIAVSYFQRKFTKATKVSDIILTKTSCSSRPSYYYS